MAGRFDPARNARIEANIPKLKSTYAHNESYLKTALEQAEIKIKSLKEYYTNAIIATQKYLNEKTLWENKYATGLHRVNQEAEAVFAGYENQSGAFWSQATEYDAKRKEANAKASDYTPTDPSKVELVEPSPNLSIFEAAAQQRAREAAAKAEVEKAKVVQKAEREAYLNEVAYAGTSELTELKNTSNQALMNQRALLEEEAEIRYAIQQNIRNGKSVDSVEVGSVSNVKYSLKFSKALFNYSRNNSEFVREEYEKVWAPIVEPFDAALNDPEFYKRLARNGAGTIRSAAFAAYEGFGTMVYDVGGGLVEIKLKKDEAVLRFIGLDEVADYRAQLDDEIDIIQIGQKEHVDRVKQNLVYDPELSELENKTNYVNGQVIDLLFGGKGLMDDAFKGGTKVFADASQQIRNDLIAELKNNGVKVTAEDVIHIGKRESDGKIIFLEKGGLNPNTGKSAGLTHILSHEPEFLQRGIAKEDLSELVFNAVTKGENLGNQGLRDGREVYKIKYKGSYQYISISVGDNGYTVGANPTNRATINKLNKQ